MHTDRASTDEGWAPDPHSYADPGVARVRHVSLDLTADFEAQVLRGRVTLDLEVAAGAATLTLDTRDLTIAHVTGAERQTLQFALGDRDPILGQRLSIALASETARVAIDYTTSPEAAALQWLAPAQTAGGRQPFLYSQGHAILTRSWIPTQDSPALRQTYDARIRVPTDLRAVMSAECIPAPREPADHDTARFDFRMAAPIPPALMALAIGDLAFAPLGPRTGVWAEPPILERARLEFVDLERMVASAEAIVGPYAWHRFDVLVMPPSFPFGGMENPRLAFVSPTILVGDRSLTSLLVHELAHAWAGNLVSNASWSDFWVNEGFTVYLELRIVEALYGRARAAMLEVYGRRELASEIERVGASSPDTRLKVNLVGRDPLDGVTVVPYVKGAALLQVIERAVGRPQFDAYLRSWFERHAFRAVTTETFVSDLRAHLLIDDQALESQIALEEWIYAPGLPAGVRHPESDALTRVESLARAFADNLPVAQLEAATWTAQEWRHFLTVVPREIGAPRLRDLDATYDLSHALNAEILTAWLRLAVANDYLPATPALERFLTEQGRRKFLAPLYTELMASERGRQVARRIYNVARPRYHATTRATLDQIVWRQE